ncbi:single-stranded DNA-binding protein [Tepidibacter thalassicus]|uniref:Single-stranded DNA-binding protein n=1 Tax=Tepidibacter thalassicus DSM 15285 TaxID=1123350 RepID=A0A1M5RYR0_9FIRM|nr:single-stranded DNA-binding protein [Tepidibacter thalassicus]SHH30943.1 single-strand DNA-binding protein [Tepidibacter thalassicus DSM 15285]
MNSVVLVGRLTRDPELRYIPGTGKPVATFSLAVNRPFTNKEGKREADFFNIVVWGKAGENCANYLSKGRLVSVKGSIQNRTYETQTGEKRYITEIIADRVEFLESKNRLESQNSVSDNLERNFEPVGLDPEGFQALDDDDIPF